MSGGVGFPAAGDAKHCPVGPTTPLPSRRHRQRLAERICTYPGRRGRGGCGREYLHGGRTDVGTVKEPGALMCHCRWRAARGREERGQPGWWRWRLELCVPEVPHSSGEAEALLHGAPGSGHRVGFRDPVRESDSCCFWVLHCGEGKWNSCVSVKGIRGGQGANVHPPIPETASGKGRGAAPRSAVCHLVFPLPLPHRSWGSLSSITE